MHNRWHPDIEPAFTVRPREDLTLECEDGLAGQVTPASVAADLLDFDLGIPHPLTGPVFVETASPGDLLEVEIVDIEPDSFGSTPLIPGFGFLADLFPDPYIIKWNIDGDIARSKELPGVAIPAAPFPGTLGVAPSHDLMARIRAREEGLRLRGGAVAGQEEERAVPQAVADGLRTIPPRETGGNVDTRQLVVGSRLVLPVHVEGALFSVGDLHFAQGDGEVSGTGLEVAGSITVRFDVQKQPSWRPRFPVFETPPETPRRWFATMGMPITDDGLNESMDLTLAGRNALIEMVNYLEATYGFERPAAYGLTGVAVDLRISEVVDVPNPIVSAFVPLDIFAT